MFVDKTNFEFVFFKYKYLYIVFSDNELPQLLESGNLYLQRVKNIEKEIK